LLVLVTAISAGGKPAPPYGGGGWPWWFKKYRISNFSHFVGPLLDLSALSVMADSEIIEAVDRLGGTVTAASVSVETGLGVDRCEDELRALMVRCDGNFEVTGEAESESVRYRFSPDLKSRAARVEDREMFLESVQSVAAYFFGFSV